MVKRRLCKYLFMYIISDLVMICEIYIISMDVLMINIDENLQLRFSIKMMIY